MATVKDLINNVLIGLRKDEIAAGATSTTDGYHKLVLQYINTAKQIVEDAWDWQVLRSTVTVTGVASQATYTLLAANEADTDVNEKSRLLYRRPGPSGTWVESSIRYLGSKPQVFDVTDSNEFDLVEVTPEEMERLHLTDEDDTVERPHKFTLYRDSDNVFFKVWPTPSGARTWKLRFVIPQGTLLATALTTTVSVPDTPIWQQALVRATLERGEELGVPGGPLQGDADRALTDAIARERTDADDTGYPE